jgi:hypothetical protein
MQQQVGAFFQVAGAFGAGIQVAEVAPVGDQGALEAAVGVVACRSAAMMGGWLRGSPADLPAGRPGARRGRTQGLEELLGARDRQAGQGAEGFQQGAPGGVAGNRPRWKAASSSSSMMSSAPSIRVQ